MTCSQCTLNSSHTAAFFLVQFINILFSMLHFHFGLAQELLKVQHKRQKFNPTESCLPFTSSNDCKSTEGKEGQRRAAVSLGIWKSFIYQWNVDCLTQRACLTVTAQWIDSSWNLHNQVVCTQELEASQRKTGANIKAALTEVFISLALPEDKLKEAVYSTDCSSYMIVALTDDNRSFIPY